MSIFVWPCPSFLLSEEWFTAKALSLLSSKTSPLHQYSFGPVRHSSSLKRGLRQKSSEAIGFTNATDVGELYASHLAPTRYHPATFWHFLFTREGWAYSHDSSFGMNGLSCVAAPPLALEFLLSDATNPLAMVDALVAETDVQLFSICAQTWVSKKTSGYVPTNLVLCKQRSIASSKQRWHY